MKGIRFILLCVLISACRPVAESVETAPPAKFHGKAQNVILMIGDGMGISQITAGMYSNYNRLNLERCPVVGLIKTHSASDLVTDSAAGATAFATGKKTYNGAIGVDADTIPQPTILEMASVAGLATGMIVTSEITHATPASFIAHQPDRKMTEEIASDFLKTDIDLFIGGGQNDFEKRKDGLNLFYGLREKGYIIYNETTPLHDLRIPPGKKLAYFTAGDKPLPKYQGRDYLPEAVAFGIDFLDKRSDKGFFMMVEGSQIDMGGHANNSDYIVSEMIEFDEVIGKVLDFAEADRHTLVIITADHETGGLGINAGSAMRQDLLKTRFTTSGHTAQMVPVFAYGPGAEAFAGIYENTEIFYKMVKAMGLHP
ncbi:MAG: alkaline phosphatase [Bacteroidia bacterium]